MRDTTVNSHGLMRNRTARSLIGVVLTALCGLLLWKAPFADPLANASYDYSFLLGSRSVTNNVTFIMMDNESYDALHQTRGQPWDRGLHAQLLNKLADDGCAMVVMDSFFGQQRDAQIDEALARAMRRQQKIVLMAEQALVAHSQFAGARPVLPTEPFYSAARTNWGVAWLDPDPDNIVRRHWPFPAPGPYPSLAGTAARALGAKLPEASHERWVRYYGQQPPWTHISYSVALKQPPNFFRGQIVFIGTQVKTSVADNEPDEFRTPYSRWTGESSAGTEIIIASFLNLTNHEWLRRSASLDRLVLLLGALVIGAGLPRLRLLWACVGAVCIAVSVCVLSISISATTNYWFPWLFVVAGQLPVALGWTLIASRVDKPVPIADENRSAAAVEVPEIPGYRLVQPPFGKGAYGTVWLAQNQRGEWRAVKVISLDKFDNDSGPYDREFEGVTRYRDICDKHSGLLRVEFVSKKFATHFYYVMELGDSLEAGWEKFPNAYKPRDLNRECARSPKRRLPIEECLRIGLILTDTLDFIHRAGMTHRDIKPQNIVFANGQPKLADLGLIAYIRPPSEEHTAVGTPGYMPPAPERPGTPQADIYALGMVLYVISTGRSPALFPELSATVLGEKDPTDFFLLNNVVLKACHPDASERYRSAREMHCALDELQRNLRLSSS
ncbi:MAG: c-type lectin fold [Verrucomicrobiales bacterium]|nr:c-type lectin fold [Verrucomicrobiales bacterium]